MKTLDKEKLFLGEEIEEKNELLSQEEKDKLANSNKEFFEKYPSDYVKSLVENKLSQTTSSKKGSTFGVFSPLNIVEGKFPQKFEKIELHKTENFSPLLTRADKNVIITV